MKLRFTKMHGISNDYVYISTFDQEVKDPEKLSVILSDRRTGIGGDGIILVCPSEIADAKMRIFNADGSEAMMCGNGIRCVGKFVYDKGLVPRYRPRASIWGRRCWNRRRSPHVSSATGWWISPSRSRAGHGT